MKTILHITAHMGGGVGKVLSGIAVRAAANKSDFRHKLLLLELPEKMDFIEECRQSKVEVVIADSRAAVEMEIAAANLVQLEWWHHPKMLPLLSDFPKIATRLIVWSHISGCYYPLLPEAFLRIPERFIFTSQYSYDNPYWQSDDKLYAQTHCSMVNSSGGFRHIEAKRTTHSGFNVGYIGTQSYAKIHPEFVEFCKSVAHLQGSRFILVGDITNQAGILHKAEILQISQKFDFVDYVADVSNEFSQFDVFGYLLNPTHFGTTENVLLEAMAAGLPVVCLNQCAEKYLIKHGETGLLVNNIKEYSEAICFLYEHPEERKRLGNNARNFVLKQFAVKKTMTALHQIYDEILCSEKKIYAFDDVFGKQPYQWFLSCLPPKEKAIFVDNMPTSIISDTVKMKFSQLPYILREKSKSSIEHFYCNYPEDAILAYWYSLLNKH